MKISFYDTRFSPPREMSQNSEYSFRPSSLGSSAEYKCLHTFSVKHLYVSYTRTYKYNLNLKFETREKGSRRTQLSIARVT